ncbi:MULTISPECIES: AAA family ATPase [Spirulina sp. CCY15215]|uniref:AAA family ATPase n=1 Tax=Spirulina sp. CCY15215 TaxID=2767591 RepID=UPI001950EA3B|nr:AAA family ATPase [Spirulina major]
MIQDIDIKNFRCFQDTKISGFERVNLIGGKNNSGKTALLEALTVYHVSKARSFTAIREMRKESSEIAEAMPERAWDNFFFNQNKSKAIEIIGQDINKQKKKIEILITDSIQADLLENNRHAKDFLDLIAKNESVFSVLKFRVEEKSENTISSIIAGSSGFYSLDINESHSDLPLIPSFVRISNKYLAEEYDKARLEDREFEVLNILQVLDPSITEIETFAIGEPTLYLKRNGQQRLPLSLFGDAINRVAAIVLKLINSKAKVLLIDEIENGIHYTSQKEFWKMLFRLSQELDTQIFATTHSWEMIRAFADVGVEDYPNLGAYFELAQKPKSDRIVGIKRDLETLEYAIEHGKNIRGE